MLQTIYRIVIILSFIQLIYLFLDVTEEENAIVNQTIVQVRENPDRILSTINQINITGNAIMRLSDRTSGTSSWMNDEIINSFLFLLVQRISDIIGLDRLLICTTYLYLNYSNGRPVDKWFQVLEL